MLGVVTTWEREIAPGAREVMGVIVLIALGLYPEKVEKNRMRLPL